MNNPFKILINSAGLMVAMLLHCAEPAVAEPLYGYSSTILADELTSATGPRAYALVITNGYGDVYRMNMLRNRANYQAYRGICSYRGFSLSGCSTTGEVVMLRINETPSMPEHFSLLSTSLRWGQTMYVLNDVFRPLNNAVMAGYENWYPFDMSCSVAMYVHSGGFGAGPWPQKYNQPDLLFNPAFASVSRQDRDAMFGASGFDDFDAGPRAYALVMTNGYGDVYRMNMLRDRANYQAYRGICSYRGFSLSGCSTTGEVVMLRIKATPAAPEYFSLVSTSLRWGQTMYFLNDVFRPLNDWVMAGYENWYPFDMSCSVAMYIHSGNLGNTRGVRGEPLKAAGRDQPLVFHDGGTNLIGALLPLTGDLADIGAAMRSALTQAMHVITNTPGMPPIRLTVVDTRTDAATAYARLVELRSNGCHLVIGPPTSEECRILKSYANENDVLLISGSATAVPLALPDDNLMRLAPDDSHQARALAELLADDGITDIAVLSRTDIYGEGFAAALIAEHHARGGVVFATNYCPRATVFIPEIVSNIAGQVRTRAAARGVDRVGVVTILFDEGIEVLRSAAAHPDLGAVRWYGGDGMAQNNLLLDDAVAAGFSAQTRYVCSIMSCYTNPLYDVVAANTLAETGATAVRSYPMAMYDGLCLAATALKLYGNTQTMSELIGNIRTIAAEYEGCTGPIIFNDSDDRANGSYDFHEMNEDDGNYLWKNLTGKIPGTPGHLAATGGAYVDRILVAWTPVSGASGYELRGSLTPDVSTAVKLADTAEARHVVCELPSDTTAYFWVRAMGQFGVGEFSRMARGWTESVPGPCVRLNDSRLPSTVLSRDELSVTIDMNPGPYLGANADWWVAAKAEDGWRYLDMSGQWRMASDIASITPAWQGALTALSGVPVLRLSGGLPVGEYQFYFGVDEQDGLLDPANIWLAQVNLTVID